MNEYLADKIATGRAILRLRPNTEWSISGKDLSTLVWYTAEVEPINQEELDAMVEVIKTELLSEQ